MSNNIFSQDLSNFSRDEIAQLFAQRGIECSNKAIDEAPIIHTAWNHPRVKNDPKFPQYRAVEDAVLEWNMEFDEWPSYWNLVDRLASDNDLSRAKATVWVKEAIEVGPWRCFITFIPASATGDTAMPTIRAIRGQAGSQLVFKCPYCKQKHFHGAAGGDGHRISHCDLGRFPQDYVIQESSVLDEWRITLVREAWHYVAARFYVGMAQVLKEAS